MNLGLGVGVMVCGLLSGVVVGEEAGGRVSYSRDLLPIFRAHCQGCHQPAKAKGGYVMTSHAGVMHSGDSGEIPVVAGDAEASYLLRQVIPVDGQAEMPRGGDPLGEGEIALIRRWIEEGAEDDSPVGDEVVYDAEHLPEYSRLPVVTSLDVSPGGEWVAVAGFHEVLLHRADGSGIEARLVGLSERVQSVRFSPRGDLLAVAGGQPGRVGELQIWDVEGRRLRLSVPVGFDTLYGVNWSPDGELVSFGMSDKTVRAVEVGTGRQVLQQMAHEDWVLGTVFSTNGSHVISVGRDMTAKLTEVATQRFVDNLTSITPGALRGGLLSVARHPTRDNVLVGGADGVPQIYEVFRSAERRIGDNAALLRKFPAMEGRVFSVDFRFDGNMIAAAATLDGRASINLYKSEYDPVIPEVLLKAYEKTSGGYSQEEREAIEKFTIEGVELLHTLKVESPVYAVRFAPDGETVYAGTGDGRVLVLGVDSGEVRREFSVAPLVESDELGGGVGGVTSRVARAEEEPGEVGVEIVAPGEVRRLSVSPERVVLGSPNEHVQLVVMAELGEGVWEDVTRVASYEVGGGLGEVNGRGWFTGLGRGRDVLAVEYGGERVDVEVDLEAFGEEVSADFIRDVNPVLTRLGCNQGTCHGAKDGKNGFKLSLRGYDPRYDVRAFVDDLAARRVNPASPDRSLLLLKATAAVPHEGGQVMVAGSEPYAILRKWIAEGAKLDEGVSRVVGVEVLPRNPVVERVGARQQVRVVAMYGDGSRRDVTSQAFVSSGNADVAEVLGGGLVKTLRRGEASLLVRYEGNYAATTVTVMGDRDGFEWREPEVNNRIDELVAAKWERMKILPSGLCTDEEFIRRVYLDLTGLPPTVGQVREFLSNERDTRSKRDALIERLLGSDEFVDHWTLKWADLLQVNRKYLGVEGAEAFRGWIRDQVSRNRPYDEFVREILTASGSNREVPAASYWKILREPTESMENTTHLFLATRFNCNKCHDHPFERWTQDQYYDLAQYFARVGFEKDEASGDRMVGGSAVEGAKPLFEVVKDVEQGGVPHDRTGKVVEPAFPFGVEGLESREGATRREQLAAWMTSAENRYFALSYVNRLWAYLLGPGLIEPIDDIRAGNPPSNPELLEHLVQEFVESGFNVRHIMRQICQSRVYQLSLESNAWNADDAINYSHAVPRRLTAEVLVDSVFAVTGSRPEFPGVKPGMRAAQLVDSAVDLPSGLLANLGRPPRESSCECERSNDLKLSSVMALLSGPAVSGAVSDTENALAMLAGGNKADREVADEVFLRVLNRHASEAEQELVSSYMGGLVDEHERLGVELERMEARWAKRLPELEAARLESIEGAELALSSYMVERAPRVAAERRERHERIASAERAVRDYEPGLEKVLRDWESGVGAEQLDTVWHPAKVQSVNGGGSAKLSILSDGSVQSVPSVGELPTYTVVVESPLTNVTGIKLEVLPGADLPAYGPGHGDGDFVVTEFSVDWASKAKADQFTRLKIGGGRSDVNAAGMELSALWNNEGEQGRKEGWSLGEGGVGRPHWAAFAFDSGVGDTNGMVLRVFIQHRFEPGHELGRFRLWVTGDESATGEGLPAGMREVVRVPERKRDEGQRGLLLGYIRGRDEGMLQRDFVLELAKRPLAEDDRLRALEVELERATRSVQVDAALLQLRRDYELSGRQMERRRLTAVQDLTWALINTPAFLFNR